MAPRRPFERAGAQVPPPGPQPHATSPFGVALWLVPGRAGHCLTWHGEHARIYLCALVSHAGGLAAGAPLHAITGRIMTLADAQAAIAAWLTDGATP